MKLKHILSLAALLACPVAAHADAVVTGFFDINDYAIVEFSVGEVTAPAFLDIHTNGSTNPDGSGADTEILLFSGLGPGATFLVSNDDDGISLTSVLSYGAGSGTMIGDSFNLGGDGIAHGENGNLPAGNYTLVIGEFSTADPPGGVGDTLANFIANGDFGNEAVDYIVTFLGDVQIIPEPSGLSLLLLGVLGFLRRR